MKKNKVILVDCDGVLLDWIHSFDNWMVSNGFGPVNEYEYDVKKRFNLTQTDSYSSKDLVKTFNQSATMGFLSPHKDAIHYVKKLHENHGYVFHVITSQTDDPYAKKLRVKNLTNLFGQTVFEKIIILGCGDDKDLALAPYKDSECYWVEDKPENADIGLSLGLSSVLMEHNHNKDYKGDAIRVKNWKQFYNLVTEGFIASDY